MDRLVIREDQNPVNLVLRQRFESFRFTIHHCQVLT
jgi:hypothetical protein